MEENEALPDHLRCKRTDGRQWRCKRRVTEGKKLCEVHHIQGRHRQNKEKVPESLKLKRERNKGKDQDVGVDEREGIIRGFKRERKEGKSRPGAAKRRRKSVGVSEALDGALRKMRLRRGDLQLELIRVFLKRQVEKRKERELEKNGGCEREFTRELPYGLMEISPAFSPGFSEQIMNNTSPSCDVKLGIDLNSSPRRCFRSKNIEPIPISTMQIVPFASNVAKLRKVKKKKCHWCRKSGFRTIVKCLSCKKEHFCTDCIDARLYVIQEVKLACPVCLGTCSCRACLTNQSKDDEQKDQCKNEKRVDKIQHLQYMIYMLLPVLEQINREQSIELELEAKFKGCTISQVQIQQDEFSCNKLRCCNNCQTSVVDFHRSCRNCSYILCLSCSEIFRGSSSRVMKAFISKCSNRSKPCKSGDKLQSKAKKISSSRQESARRFRASPTTSPKWKACNDNGGIICPPLAFGGCGDGILDLSCVLPFSWTKELELSAKELICSYCSPEAQDASSCCSLCKDNKACKRKVLQGGASREDLDKFLYCPSAKNLCDENLGHFQKHWSEGQPVIVRRVVKSRPDLSWDPVVMFCTYLEKSSNRSQNDKEAGKATNCLDWCEIEICRKQLFMGSLEGRSHANMRYELLKLKVWLSSYLLQEQFPDHYAEIIRALPLQEYLNPVSGLLNLLANLPKDTANPSLGPGLYISFGCPDDLMQPDFLTKLSYDSHDVVNILVHTTDVPISSEQLTKIKNLMKCCRSQDNNTGGNTREKMGGEEKSSVLSGNTEESSMHDIMEEGLRLPNGAHNTNLSDVEGHDSESESEASILCSGITQSSEDSDDQNFFRDQSKSSNFCAEQQGADSCGAQWDIFRRQDVPKLLEYLSRHSNEFSHTYSFPQSVIHPILDQRFYLDVTHKTRLKEEFNIEPWTFKQNLGEAVMIPAGCPYQIRKLKSCVNVILDFISPENATECINLIDKLRLLPVHHKARKNMLEVKKMTLGSLSAAVKEMSNLNGAL